MNSENSFLGSFWEKVGAFMPDALGALIVLFLGILLAAFTRKGTKFLLEKLKLDERINKKLNNDIQVETSIASFAYYLVLLFILMLVLSILNVEGVLEPLQDMFGKFVGYIPNIIAAGVIGFAGYLIARIASVIVGTAASGIDVLSQKIGMSDVINLSKLVQQLVFLFIFVPILILALDALNMSAISDPATQMLNELMAAIPNIIGAAIILGVAFVFGKFVTSMLSELLSNLGADKIPEKLELKKIVGKNFKLSKLAGNVVFFFIMFFAVISALEKLEMTEVSTVLSDLLELAGKIVLGMAILVIGNFFSNMAHKFISKGENSKVLATLARYAILALVLAIGLNAMGLADTVVHLAFGLTLGAIAVAFALSFGLGGREAAGKHTEYLLEKFRSEKIEDKKTVSKTAGKES